MRNIGRLNAEIKFLMAYYGQQQIWWPDNYSWIRIEKFKMPCNINSVSSEVLVIVPENYGYGEPYKDCFIKAGLRVWHPTQYHWVEIPHYFDKENAVNKYYDKNWRYMCIHQDGWNPAKDNIMTYLNQVYTFLCNPFRDWNRRT